ncbi:DnaJ C-terminal domain-containing protein [Caenimonas terrae]|uniref:DnaJ C-terminal domain-containing protein n=1 Tax=Caenimonas terrae TaxID=696074 RepID=A0ABW0NLF6_9BURK
MKYKDYYEALGVPRDADLAQIKKAYRKLAREHHPDVSKAGGGSEARFKEVAEAYATLKDPEKRKAYDELGRRPQGEEFAPPPQWEQHFGSRAGGFGDIDLEELLASLGRGRGAAGAGARGPRPVDGRDYETTVSLGLEDAHRGTTVNLEVGEGQGARTLEIKIPPGVTDGQKLRLKGKGGKGRNGGADGDIYLHLTLAPHPVFRVDRHDLYFDLLLAPWEAALGAEVEVPTLDGPVVLTVAPGTRSGRKLRLRGRGMANGSGGRGDLYAVALIDVPPTLSERERELFAELAKVSNFNPRGGQHGNASR